MLVSAQVVPSSNIQGLFKEFKRTMNQTIAWLVTLQSTSRVNFYVSLRIALKLLRIPKMSRCDMVQKKFNALREKM